MWNDELLFLLQLIDMIKQKILYFFSLFYFQMRQLLDKYVTADSYLPYLIFLSH